MQPLTHLEQVEMTSIPPKVIDDHIVRAKKEWVCSACGTPIFVSQRHRRIIWKDRAVEKRDDKRDFHCDHVHLRCWPQEGVAST